MALRLNVVGQKFGRLEVVEFVGRKNNSSWFRCVCECGGETTTTSNNLMRGHTVSCGCVNIEKFIERSFKHGISGEHPLFISWIGMRNRCSYKKHNRYKHYGGKGIKVCDEWKDDFKAFYDWALENGWQEGLSIERKENELDYCPSNCKFATIQEQSRNRTSNVNLTYNGETKCVTDWAKEVKSHAQTISKRVKRGWTPHECLFGKKKSSSTE